MYADDKKHQMYALLSPTKRTILILHEFDAVFNNFIHLGITLNFSYTFKPK